MSDVTQQDFIDRFPEFSESVVEDNWNKINPQWECYYCGTYGSTCQNERILNLMAHLLILETQNAPDSKKSAASKSVGSVSVSFTAGATDENTLFFNTTKYGQRFLMLVKADGNGAFFV